MTQRPTRRRYTAKYKADILAEYEQLDKLGKGELLRREGLYTSLISAWRLQRDRGALAGLATAPGGQPKDPRDRELDRLRAENQRLAKDLKASQEVVEIQSKLSALLEGLTSGGATQAGPNPSGPGRR